jgi:hypothetical protein
MSGIACKTYAMCQVTAGYYPFPVVQLIEI